MSAFKRFSLNMSPFVSATTRTVREGFTTVIAGVGLYTTVHSSVPEGAGIKHRVTYRRTLTNSSWLYISIIISECVSVCACVISERLYQENG